MRFISAILFAVMFIAPANATSVKLSINNIMMLRIGLAALDGSPQIVKDGAKETTVTVPYKFGPGLRLVIAHNIVSCDSAISTVRVAAKPISDELQRFQGTKDHQSEIDKDTAALNTMGEAEQMLDLEKIPSKELNLELNQIPSSVLAAISPVLEN